MAIQFIDTARIAPNSAGAVWGPLYFDHLGRSESALRNSPLRSEFTAHLRRPGCAGSL